MLYQVMKHIRNFFPVKHYEDKFTIEDGQLTLPFSTGKYILIEGSVLNDGVHVLPATFQDETFTGCVTLLAPPMEFIELVDEIKAWQESNADALSKPYASESFAGYSYSRATNSAGQALSWKDVFGPRLDVWRKV